jgi:hypothetical protein
VRAQLNELSSQLQVQQDRLNELTMATRAKESKTRSTINSASAHTHPSGRCSYDRTIFLTAEQNKLPRSFVVRSYLRFASLVSLEPGSQPVGQTDVSRCANARLPELKFHA